MRGRWLTIRAATYLALVDELTEHDRRYYVDAAPTISDVEYDQLLQAAARARGRAPRLGRRLVADPARRPRAGLGVPQGRARRSRCCRSTTRTARTTCARSTTAWSRASTATASTYSIEPKIDGFGIELTYKQGLLDARRDARRRPDRRGRHARTCARCAASRCGCASRSTSSCAARST